MHPKKYDEDFKKSIVTLYENGKTHSELFSIKVISWLLADKPDSNLVIDSFKKAYRSRNCPQGIMFPEETNCRTYYNLTDLQVSLFEYIEGFYNVKRPHSAIHFLTPADFESIFFYSL